LGESIHNDVFYPFIPKGSKIPISKTYSLTTVSDNQVNCNTDIRYGESKIGSTNTRIGAFTITDIPPLPKGVPGMITTFSIDEYGILTVSVKVRETGNHTINKFDISNLIV
jgi:molecular chaperone DnaK (HSP70)